MTDFLDWTPTIGEQLLIAVAMMPVFIVALAVRVWLDRRRRPAPTPPPTPPADVLDVCQVCGQPATHETLDGVSHDRKNDGWSAMVATWCADHAPTGAHPTR